MWGRASRPSKPSEARMLSASTATSIPRLYFDAVLTSTPAHFSSKVSVEA